MKKRILLFLLMLGCFILGNVKASAQTLSGENADWRTANTFSTRAIRYNFDEYLDTYDTVIRTNAQENGNFQYIRVRLEPGSGGGDTVRISAAAGVMENTASYTMGSAVVKPKNAPMIIDFKAPNAPVRSEATHTINCSVVNGVSSEDYCVLNNSLYYGIKIYDGSLLGGTVRVYGGYSLEN